MKPFTYERARTPAEAAAAAARIQGAKFIAGGTNLLDLMKLQIETPAHLIDVNDLGARQDRADAGRRLEDRRAGAQHRSRGRRARAARLRRARRARCSPAPPGSCATRRPRRATCCSARAAPTSTTPTSRATSAARQRLRGDRRLQPAARHRRRERCLHRDAPERHGGRDARARCDGRDGAAQRLGAHDPDRRLPPAAGQHAAHRERARARRADHRGDAAQAGRRHAHLSQGARPRFLRLRAGLGRRDRAARRHRPRRAGRRGAQAVARRGGRARDAARRQGGRGRAPRRRTHDARQRIQGAAGASARSPRCSPKRKAEP